MMVRTLVALLAFATTVVAQPRIDTDGDPLPEGALARFGTVRYRSGAFQNVQAFALSPDGKTLAIETLTDIAYWDIQTGRVGARLSRPDDGIGSVIRLRYAPEGKSLVRLSEQNLRVLDAQTGEQHCNLELRVPGKGIAFIPGTSQFALLQGDGSKLYVFDARDGNLVSDFEPEVPVQFASPSGAYFLGEYGSRWHIVDAATGRVRRRLEEMPEIANKKVMLTPDDRWICVFGTDGRLDVFDAQTGKRFDRVEPPTDWGDSDWEAHLTLSADGAIAYLSRRNQRTCRRDLAAKKWLTPLPAMPAGPLIPHPDGKCLLQIGDDGVFRRYDLGTLKEVSGPHGFAYDVLPAPSPDGRRIAITSGELNGRLDMFDVAGGLLWTAPLGRSPGYPRWSPDGRSIAAAEPGELKIFEVQTGKIKQTFRSPDPALAFTGLIGFDRGRDKLFAALNNGEGVAEFDLKSVDPVQVVRTDLRGAVDLSPDCRTLVISDGSLAPALFDLSQRRLRIGFTFPPPPRMGCGGGGNYRDSASNGFSPDGSYLLTWERGMGLFWNPMSGEPEKIIRTGYEHITDSAFSPDGLWLAVVSDAHTISLLDVASEKMLVAWDGPPDQSIRTVAFAGSGRLVTSGDDLTALLWDLRPRKKLKVSPWEALCGDDPTDAYRGVWALAEDPKGPEVLRAKVVPAKPTPPGPLQKWIADLGANRYAVREEATSVLEELGRRIEPELRAAREQTASEEVRTRLDAILAKLPRARNETEVIHARAVAAMELAGTDASRKLLGEWAAGAPGARLTQDAKAALIRLGATR